MTAEKRANEVMLFVGGHRGDTFAEIVNAIRAAERSAAERMRERCKATALAHNCDPGTGEHAVPCRHLIADAIRALPLEEPTP